MSTVREEVLDKIGEFGDAVKKNRAATDSRIDEVQTRIELLESLADRPKKSGVSNKEKEKQEKAFLDYLRDGKTEGLSKSTKSVNIATGAAGGYAVPELIDETIEREMKSGTPWLDLCKVVSGVGAEYRHLVSDRSYTSSTSSESGSRSETNTMLFREVQPTHGEIYALPKVTNWALQDVFFDLTGFLNQETADEFANQVDSQVVSGTGSDEMTGFVTSTPESEGDNDSPRRTAGVYQYVASGSASEIPHDPSGSPQSYGPDALVDLIKALRAPYRANASWAMNSNTLAEIMKWRDADGRGYIGYDITTGAPTQLLGYPLSVSESMQDIGADAFPIAFGDWGRGYLITRYGELLVVTDPYSAKGFTSIYFAQRYGGKILNDQAVKLMKIATS